MRIEPGMCVVRYSHSPRVITTLKPSPLSSFSFNSWVSVRSVSFIRQTPSRERLFRAPGVWRDLSFLDHSPPSGFLPPANRFGLHRHHFRRDGSATRPEGVSPLV